MENIQYAGLEDLKENPNNPRHISKTNLNKLIKSIEEFPKMLELRPVIVDNDMVVLGGNMRLKACKEIGIQKIPYIKVDNLTEDQKQEFIIKDNVGFGDWDWDIIEADFDTELLFELGLEIPELDLKEVEDERDISDTIETTYRVEAVLEDEEEQEKLYNKLINEGYECRILTL